MSEFLSGIVSYFYSDLRYKEQTRQFKKSLYLISLVNAFYWLRYYSLFFGSSSVVYHSASHASGPGDLTFLLYHSEWQGAGALCIAAVIVICGLSLWFTRSHFLADVILWLLVLNIHNTLYATLTGGNFLLNQFLFFNCFLSFTSKRSSGKSRDLNVLLHNFSVIAIILQICLAYFLAALSKLADPLWVHGEAMASVMQIEHFSLYSALDFDPGFKSVYRIFNFVVLFFQLLFPVFVWIKPLKKPLLLLGIAIHLYISLMMGLFMFGIIMIVGLLFFWPVRTD